MRPVQHQKAAAWVLLLLLSTPWARARADGPPDEVSRLASSSALSELEARVESWPSESVIQRELEYLDADTSKRFRTDLASVRVGLDFWRLFDLRSEWARSGGDLERWTDWVSEQAIRADEVEQELEALVKSLTQSPQTLQAERIQAQALLRRVRERRKVLRSLGNMIRAIDSRITKVRSQIRGAESISGPAGHLRTAAPLWRVDALAAWREKDLANQALNSLQRHQRVSQRFFRERSGRLAFQFVLVVFFVLFFRWERRHWYETRRSSTKTVETDVLLSRPVAMGFLLSLYITPALQLHPPLIFVGLLEVVALIVTFQVLRPRFPKFPAAVFFAPCFLALVGWLRVALLAGHPLERWLLTCELMGHIAVAVAFTRLVRQDVKSLTRPARTFVSIVLLSLAVVLAIALAANVIGWVRLAHRLDAGSMQTAYFALMSVTVYRVLTGLIEPMMQHQLPRKLQMVRRRKKVVTRKLRKAAAIFTSVIWVYAVLSIFSLWEEVRHSFSLLMVSSIRLGNFSVQLGEVLALLAAILGSIYISKLLRFVLDHDVLPRLKLAAGVPYAISTTTGYVILLLGFLIALSAGGIDLSKFAVLAGALGVGIGFGLQNIVNNFVSGLILLFERPVRVGDVIEVNQVLGTVRRIGVRASILQTLEGAEVLVPNANLVSDSVTNWTHSDRRRRIDVVVGVKYGSDPDQVRQLLREVALADARLLPEPAPEPLFQGFGDSSLNFQLRVWTDQYDEWIRIRSDLNVAVNKALATAGVEIPFPQRDLHIRSMDAHAIKSVTSAMREDEK